MFIFGASTVLLASASHAPLFVLECMGIASTYRTLHDYFTLFSVVAVNFSAVARNVVLGEIKVSSGKGGSSGSLALEDAADRLLLE